MSLLGHNFRHEYAKLVAMLVRRVGNEHIELVEDAVQSALLTAMDSWLEQGEPEQPTAWLYRVALNNIISDLRQSDNRSKLLDRYASELFKTIDEEPQFFLDSEIQDDMLNMLFICCHEEISEESQLVLALKTLCGFSVSEISHRLFCREAGVYKRLKRARERLLKVNFQIDSLNLQEIASRVDSVNKILYLIFTEGYLSTSTESVIRREMCDEALRLTKILIENPRGQHPNTFALLALMYFHLARFNSRMDTSGGLILLEQQNRSDWDMWSIQQGMYWLEKSAEGDEFSRYHAEASVSAEHCMAPSFEETRWDRVVESYALLEKVTSSPLHRLNRAIATAEWQGPESGLRILSEFDAPLWLQNSYLWEATLSDLQRRCGNESQAVKHFESALKLAPSDAIKSLLQQRLHIN